MSRVQPSVLTVGDALVALSPSAPVRIEDTDALALHAGGAEMNTAVGVRRLGVRSAWLGRVGDDPLGRRLRRTLDDEGVDASLVVTDPHAPTALYLREWLADGRRRPYYYRRGTAGARLRASDWPQPWPATLPPPSITHLTGITAALSADAGSVLATIVGQARALGASVSVDPNHRSELWPDAATARAALQALIDLADIVLLSEEDAELLTGTTDPERVCTAIGAARPTVTVLKLGARGAVGRSGSELVAVPAAPARAAIDPVGAGDAFNAGFLTAWLRGAGLSDALACGAWCGARAVEVLGEHTGYPRLDELPSELQSVLRARDVVGVDD